MAPQIPHIERVQPSGSSDCENIQSAKTATDQAGNLEYISKLRRARGKVGAVSLLCDCAAQVTGL